MDDDAYATIAVAGIGMVITWAAWVSVSLFKLTQEIALIKQGFALLRETKIVLGDLRDELKSRNPRRS